VAARSVKVRLRLSLGMLEQFGMVNATGALVFGGSLKSGVRLYRMDPAAAGRRVEIDHAGKATITATGEWMEIVVPAEFFRNNPNEVSVAWIDAFRA
jgi:hypothetical protein